MRSPVKTTKSGCRSTALIVALGRRPPMYNARNILIAFSILILILILILMTGCSGSSSSGPASKLYVGLFGENAVAVVDTRTGAVLSKIAVPTGPHGLVIT